jgi:CPA1 family monovalent cation:H+ antiporter
MEVVHSFETILVLMAVVVGLDVLARKVRLPPAAAQIAGGIGLTLIPGTPHIALDPDLALVLFLPPLLMADAYTTAWRDFRANLRIILQLAVGAVVFTTLAVGVIAHAVVPELPWAACFALGAIISPPDAVAASAVLERVSLPRRVVVLLEGESLINDASGLVLYRFSVAAALTGGFSAAHAAASFVLVSAGGVAIGLAFGYLGTVLLGRLREPNLATVSSFLLGWGSYIAAEELSASGVLAVVACGMVVGRRQHVMLTAETRLAARATWLFAQFVLQSLIFILIGLSLHELVARLGWGAEFATLMWPAAAIVGAVILSRFAWVILTTYLVRAALPAVRRRDPYPPLAVPVVVSWAGMRGVVSLAAALALPTDFPGRDFILAATFIVILVTVMVQGTTLGPLIRWLRVDRFDGPEQGTLRESEARARLADAKLAAIRRVSTAEDGTQRHPRLLEQFEHGARATSRFSTAEEELLKHRQDHFSAVLAAVEAGRAELLRMYQRGDIHDSVLVALEAELDLQEITARRFTDDP